MKYILILLSCSFFVLTGCTSTKNMNKQSNNSMKEWQQSGFSQSDAIKWQHAGFSLEEAKNYKDKGYIPASEHLGTF